MRRPAIRKFLLWLPPALFGGLVAIVTMVAALAQAFPRFRRGVSAGAEVVWRWFMSEVIIFWTLIGMFLFSILVYVAALAWASTPRRLRWTDKKLDRLHRAIDRTAGNDLTDNRKP